MSEHDKKYELLVKNRINFLIELRTLIRRLDVSDTEKINLIKGIDYKYAIQDREALLAKG